LKDQALKKLVISLQKDYTKTLFTAFENANGESLRDWFCRLYSEFKSGGKHDFANWIGNDKFSQVFKDVRKRGPISKASTEEGLKEVSDESNTPMDVCDSPRAEGMEHARAYITAMQQF
jgi:hypothetical protein